MTDAEYAERLEHILTGLAVLWGQQPGFYGLQEAVQVAVLSFLAIKEERDAQSDAATH